MSGKLKVYYNSACPVCDAGIKGQRGRMNGCGADVEWIDIHANGAAVQEIGAEQEFVRERLHVVDENGKLNVGADAFAALWRNTPRQRWMAWLIRMPGASSLARLAYNLFAERLYKLNRAKGRW